MSKFTISNDFHNSTATVKIALGAWLSKSQIARVRAQLCGISGCTCGGNLSERGKQSVEIDVAGQDRIRLLAQ